MATHVLPIKNLLAVKLSTSTKWIRSLHTVGYKLVFYEFGNPSEVMRMECCDVPDPAKNEVLLEILAAPIQPVDINIIQGKYPMKLTLPAIPGAEGVGRVVKVGDGVEKFKEGDHVVPLFSRTGTWQSHLLSCQDHLMTIPKELGVVEAAGLAINPSTINRMLKDFVQLRQGDTLIQNGSNSACGQIAIQMCKLWSIKTVNIVRDRPEICQLKDHLLSLGATIVFTEDEIRKTSVFKKGILKRPKLALNCVGGQGATELVRHLDHGGVMVTYGGMSMEPVRLSTSSLIFNDVRLYGFSQFRWSKESDNRVVMKTYEDLISMYVKGDLKKTPYDFISFENYKIALKNTLSREDKVGKKYLLKFGEFS
ncbi:hypothetical protein JTB14_031706 [Gonioctena quinquepunctata]|nr:hypothetical protein JTB14_031706 [Gonioctena quinquepunctata]